MYRHFALLLFILVLPSLTGCSQGTIYSKEELTTWYIQHQDQLLKLAQDIDKSELIKKMGTLRIDSDPEHALKYFKHMGGSSSDLLWQEFDRMRHEVGELDVLSVLAERTEKGDLSIQFLLYSEGIAISGGRYISVEYVRGFESLIESDLSEGWLWKMPVSGWYGADHTVR